MATPNALAIFAIVWTLGLLTVPTFDLHKCCVFYIRFFSQIILGKANLGAYFLDIFADCLSTCHINKVLVVL
jgi:hypothetical protein